MPLLDKYKDYHTNPANETIDQVVKRITNLNGAFCKILFNNILVGGICVYWKEGTQFWIRPMFILPYYQGNGIAPESNSFSRGKIPRGKNLGIMDDLRGAK